MKQFYTVLGHNKVFYVLPVLLLLCANAFALSGEVLERISTGVVQIVPQRNGSTQPAGSSGSGTLIDKEKGLVLTNYHVVSNDRGTEVYDTSVINVSLAPDKPPVPAFRAYFVTGNKELDIAVLRVYETLPGAAIKLSDLHAFDWNREATWRKTTTLHLNEDIIILGYPGYQFERQSLTINVTRGSVSGFIPAEDGTYSRAWIKTDAALSFGNSGGTAIDDEGHFIGVPSAFIEDSRQGRLGLVRAADLAVPYIEQFFKDPSLRPHLVRPAPESRTSPGSSQSGTTGKSGSARGGARFTTFVFSNKVEGSDRISQPMAVIPATQASVVYAGCEFDGMTDGTPYQVVWTRDEEEVSKTVDTWSLGTKGRFITMLKRSDAQPVPPGYYTVTLSSRGTTLQTGRIRISDSQPKGGGTTSRSSEPSQSTPVGAFGRVISAESGRPLSGAVVIVLKPGVSAAQFLANQDSRLIAIAGNTDIRGVFQLAARLDPGYNYSIVVGLRGYRPLSSEGALSIPATQQESIDMGVIRLSR